MQTDFDKDLLTYFTDVEHLRDKFRQTVAAPTLPKRLFVVWGIGGVGKSSLLRMFRLHCKEAGAPVALASGDEAKSVLDVLARWMDDLKATGVVLSSFGRTLEYYRTILARAESQTGEIAGKMVKGVAKTATETMLSTVPGFGPLLAKLGGTGVDALTDVLLSRGFKKPDIDLLLNPASKLTDDFLADVAQVADGQRLVLMLDTFEQMPGLEDWTRSLAQRLHENVLLVIAGRALPDWNRAWPEWLAKTQVAELKPMSDDVMRDLVRRYYATMRGGEPDPQQVEAIIRFARGLPIVVTSVVQLWVKYPEQMGDLQAISAEVMADLVDRLVDGVPQEMLPALEAAAAVRWFDQPILRAVMGLTDVRELYNELRRFPFARPRAEGLALHDAVREIIDANLRAQDADRHFELHERAVAYFEKRLERVTGEEAERLGLERLYHRILADEEAGIGLFQEMAQELTRYRLLNRLRGLLNDVDTYPLKHHSSRLWREYYHARLWQFEFRFSDAETAYQRISEDHAANAKLQAYALCDWGEISQLSNWLGEPGGSERAIRILDRSLRIAPQVDEKLIFAYCHMRGVFVQQGDTKSALDALQSPLKFFQDRRDLVGVVETLALIKSAYALTGDLRKALDTDAQAMEVMPENPFLRIKLIYEAPWVYFLSGRYREGEDFLLNGYNHVEQSGDSGYWVDFLQYSGYASALQGKHVDTAALGRQLGSVRGFYGATLLEAGDLQGAEENLLHSIATKERGHDTIGLPEVFYWLGELHEVRAQLQEADAVDELRFAESQYDRALRYRQWGRHNWQCAVLAGLVRIRYTEGDYTAISPLLIEAEQLAQHYEYNDHLATLRLTQAHIAWEGKTFEVAGNAEGLAAFDAALRYYQHAIIYALRFNRFLLDESLRGRPQGTPLRPIIPHCLARGVEGRRMLLALRDWWQIGVNDIGAPRPNTISPIPEGVALLEAERIAREREPGDGSPQASILDQIEEALTRSG